MKRIATFITAAATLLGLGFLATPDSADGQQAGEIRFVLTGVDADEGGTIRCALYNDEDSWLDKSRRYRRASARVRGGQATCVFRNVTPGTYAAAALHDANGDRRMEKGALGLPQEGYAISRDEHDAMSAPDFDDAAIEFEGGRIVTRASMRY